MTLVHSQGLELLSIYRKTLKAAALASQMRIYFFISETQSKNKCKYLWGIFWKWQENQQKWPSLTRKHFYSLFDFESKRFRYSSMSNLFHCCSRHLENFSSLQIDIAMKFLWRVIIGIVECFPSYKASLVNYFYLIMKFYYRLSHFATQDVKYISLTIFLVECLCFCCHLVRSAFSNVHLSILTRIDLLNTVLMKSLFVRSPHFHLALTLKYIKGCSIGKHVFSDFSGVVGILFKPCRSSFMMSCIDPLFLECNPVFIS